MGNEQIGRSRSNKPGEQAGETGQVEKAGWRLLYACIHDSSLYLKTQAVTARGEAQAAEGQGTPPVDAAKEASSYIVETMQRAI